MDPLTLAVRVPLIAGILACAVALGVLAFRVRRRPPAAATRRRRRRAVGAATVTAIAAGTIAAATAAGWALPRLDLPEPAGPLAVGTTRIQWADAGEDPRILVARLWYPADEATGERAGYLADDPHGAEIVVDALAGPYGLPAIVLDGVLGARASGIRDAAPADVGRLPIVLFSPGLASISALSTAWAEHLASSGYLVVGLDHLRDAAAVVLDDGTVVRSEVAATGDDEQDRRDAERWTAVRAADLRAAITRLELLDLGAADARGVDFTGRLDLERIATAGHPLGGAAAVLAAATDDRVVASIVLDGHPGDARPAQPVLMVVAGAGTGSAAGDARYAEAVDELLAASRSSERLLLPGVAHLGLIDAALFLPPLPSLIGTAGREEGVLAAAIGSREFLDQHLAPPR